MPFLDKFDDVVFDIAFWGQEIVSSVVIEVTAQTSESVFMVSSGSEMNSLFSVEHNSATHARDHQSGSINSFNSELTDVDWQRSNWLVFNVNSTSRNKFDIGFQV